MNVSLNQALQENQLLRMQLGQKQKEMQALQSHTNDLEKRLGIDQGSVDKDTEIKRLQNKLMLAQQEAKTAKMKVEVLTSDLEVEEAKVKEVEAERDELLDLLEEYKNTPEPEKKSFWKKIFGG